MGNWFFHTLFNFASPVVSVIAWVSPLLGITIQMIALAKAKRKWARWLFVGILAVILIAAECACQIITGWDLILYLVIYGAVLLMLVGAGLGALIFIVRNRRKANV